MNQDNINKSGNLIVGEKLPVTRDQLKARIKEIIKKYIKETSTSSSCGSYNTPKAFGKVKDPVSSLGGYSVVGSSDTGTLDEKKEKESEKKPTTPKEKTPVVKKSGHDEPMIKQKSQLDKISDKLKSAEAEIQKFKKTGK